MGFIRLFHFIDGAADEIWGSMWRGGLREYWLAPLFSNMSVIATLSGIGLALFWAYR